MRTTVRSHRWRRLSGCRLRARVHDVAIETSHLDGIRTMRISTPQARRHAQDHTAPPAEPASTPSAAGAGPRGRRRSSWVGRTSRRHSHHGDLGHGLRGWTTSPDAPAPASRASCARWSEQRPQSFGDRALRLRDRIAISSSLTTETMQLDPTRHALDQTTKHEHQRLETIDAVVEREALLERRRNRATQRVAHRLHRERAARASAPAGPSRCATAPAGSAARSPIERMPQLASVAALAGSGSSNANGEGRQEFPRLTCRNDVTPRPHAPRPPHRASSRQCRPTPAIRNAQRAPRARSPARTRTPRTPPLPSQSRNTRSRSSISTRELTVPATSARAVDGGGERLGRNRTNHQAHRTAHAPVPPSSQGRPRRHAHVADVATTALREPRRRR